MALSPSHRLGQIIGEELEAAISRPMSEIAAEFGMYLDYQHSREVRGGKKKVGWDDSMGNTHYLDYVIEEGGSDATQGRPRAFIESAWRRYTKHSKNKTQEIEGALRPIAEKYRNSSPFLGVILAGEFTGPSLEQFKSHSFNVLYCPYQTIVQAFKNAGADVSFGEGTSDQEMQSKVDAFEKLSKRKRSRIAEQIRILNAERFTEFFDRLKTSLSRRIDRVFVLPLSGASQWFYTVQDAINFISSYNQSAPSYSFVRYELNVRYSNNDEIRATFHDRQTAIEFLSSIDR